MMSEIDPMRAFGMLMHEIHALSFYHDPDWSRRRTDMVAVELHTPQDAN
jgi:hypothetical protein